jgi:hypothetical protein
MNTTGSNFSRALRSGVILGALAVGALALGANEASAQWRHRGGGGWGGPGIAAGVLGGVAAGAIIAGAGNPYYGYGPAPVPVYGPGPRCWFEREDVWNGYNYVRQRVRVCE